jgi:hypothetical protein
MIIYSEIGSSYHHKPIDQGVYYSPFMVEIKDEVWVKEERVSEGDSSRSSPSNLSRFSLCFVVSCFSIASSRERLRGRGLYIVVF